MFETLEQIHVVLVKPSLPQNIGSAARAMANMGLTVLKVVAPRSLEWGPMRALATEKGEPLLKTLQVFDDLDQALLDCQASVGATARTGKRRGVLMEPRQAAPEILAWAAQGPVALMFGTEDRGLTTEELDRCRLSVTIPTSESASLNLAQAVIVLCYELRLAARAADGRDSPRGPRPAPLAQLHPLLDHLREAFDALNVFGGRNPEEYMRTLKAPLERAGMTTKEVKAWRGVGRQGLWAAQMAKRLLEKEEKK